MGKRQPARVEIGKERLHVPERRLSHRRIADVA